MNLYMFLTTVLHWNTIKMSISEERCGTTFLSVGEIDHIISSLKIVPNNTRTANFCKMPSFTGVRGLPIRRWKVLVLCKGSLALVALWISDMSLW